MRHTYVAVNFIDIYFRTGRYPLALPNGLGSRRSVDWPMSGSRARGCVAGCVVWRGGVVWRAGCRGCVAGWSMGLSFMRGAAIVTLRRRLFSAMFMDPNGGLHLDNDATNDFTAAYYDDAGTPAFTGDDKVHVRMFSAGVWSSF